MVDRLVFIRTWLLFLFNVTTFFFPEDQGLNIDSVSAVKVLDDVNGKQYILSDEQLLYVNSPAGCAAINASPAIFDTNADFMAVRNRLHDLEFLQYESIWVNITFAGTGAGTRYFWEKEEVNRSLWWSEEPNRQGAGDNPAECNPVSDICRPVQMTRVRGTDTSDIHYLMDTCCLNRKYFICEDIDECHQHDLCAALSQCINTLGSYRCQCNPGYQPTASGLCEDIDECHQHDLCPDLGHCVNTPGSYHCQCNPGYQLSASGLCKDIDECNSTGTFICPTNSTCSNTRGSYICLCNEGYQMNNTVCEDIDECNSTDTFTCPTDSTCSNTPGSYICLCNAGYQMNNTVCEDIDECNSTGTFICPINSTCSNTHGSYICLCNQGYEMNNTVCEDADECQSTDTFTCPANSTCSNTPGSYTCLCNAGYEMNNTACEEVPSPLVIMTSPGTAVRLGSTVTLFCQTFSLAHSSTTLYHWLKDGVDLQNPHASLRLDNVTKQDEGGFQCYITDGVNLEASRSIPFMLTLISENQAVSDQTTIKCPCRCRRYPVYDSTERPTVGISLSYIQMEKLSSRIRARTSAYDWHVTAVTTGCSAVAVLLCLLFATAAVDILTVFLK